MPPPMRLKNQRVWTDTPSGHKVTKRASSPAPSNDEEGKDDSDDG